MPNPGDYDPATGSVWDGQEWAGGTGNRPSAGMPAGGAATPGQTDSKTGAIWDGTKWVGGTQTPAAAAPKPPPASAATPAPVAPTYDPSGTAGGIPGMTNLQTDAFRSAAATALKQLGVLDYQPTNDELRSFFKQGFDAEGIANYYMTDPTFVARNPGVPYGLSRDTYNQRVGELGTAFSSVFAGQDAPQAPGPNATKAERDSSLFGYALKNNISGSQLSSTLEGFRETRGRAPSQSEYASYAGEKAAGAGQIAGGGNSGSGIKDARQKDSRPAVGGRGR